MANGQLTAAQLRTLRNLALGRPSHTGAWPGGSHDLTLSCLERRGLIAYRGGGGITPITGEALTEAGRAALGQAGG